jgi:hypothetical protein
MNYLLNMMRFVTMKTGGRFRERHEQCYEGRSAFNIITTPEMICDVFSFLDKDQIERIQLVNQFWNNVIIRHKNILPLRQFVHLTFNYDQIYLFVTEEDRRKCISYIIKFDGTNLSKGTNKYVSSRYSKLTVDEVLTNLNDVVFDLIQIQYYNSEDFWDYFLKMMKLVTTKTGGRFRGQLGTCYNGRFGSKLDEIFGKGFLNTARYKIHPN